MNVPLFVLILLGGLSLYIASTMASGDISNEGVHSPLSQPEGTYEIALETETLPELEPHEHIKYEDSILDDEHGVFVNSPVFTPEEDIWITGMEMELQNAPQKILHHSLLFELGQPNTICPNTFDRELGTFGRETPTVLSFPAPYGMLVKAGQPIQLEVMLHNGEDDISEGVTYYDVSAIMRLTYEKADGDRNRPLIMYHLSLADPLCDRGAQEGAFAVPPNTNSFVRVSEPQKENNPSRFTFSEPGNIFIIGGHIHAWEGGEKLDTLIDGQVVQTHRSAWTTEGEWVYYPSSNVTWPIYIQGGEEVTLEATYSNPTNLPVRGAMGVAVIYFAPDQP